MAAVPRVAKSLETLRNQLNAKFPNRSKASDGWIGDARHAAEGDYKVTQHMPLPNGAVCALDITHDPAHGVDIAVLMEQLDACNDPRIFYLIANRQIDNSDDSRTSYSGVDAHTNHLHISVRWQSQALYDDARPWNIPLLGATTQGDDVTEADKADLVHRILDIDLGGGSLADFVRTQRKAPAGVDIDKLADLVVERISARLTN